MDAADIIIHIHPDFSANDQQKIEQALSTLDGIVSVHFSPGHPHIMTVDYDPQANNSDTILAAVREWDQEAMMAGL